MAHSILPRKLWYESKDNREFLDQYDLLAHREPIIVLGEAGMGKTELLSWLGKQPGYAYCTARQLKIAQSDPRRLLGNATTLVIDALDELSVRGEGDAVDLVLERLQAAGWPHFVLSCRAADWRNATSVSAIREYYSDIDPLILHLEPLTDEEIQNLLTDELSGDATRATAVVDHFEKSGLRGLLANPQTLELVSRVARDADLPDTKAGLFERSVELLRREHRADRADFQPDEETALDAAGAAFAAIILTGADGIGIEQAEPVEGELPLREVAALPGAARLETVIGSRLFAGRANHFSYWHRRIGEFVGARWLARQATSTMARKRLLALFQSYGVVPASLRGLHAWLAHHSPDLAADVIENDPMGLVEYGDADSLNTAQAHSLLSAIAREAERNPHFKGWQQYSTKGLAEPAMLETVRHLLFDPQTGLGLRVLLIEAVAGSPIAEPLRLQLRYLLVDPKAPFILRSRAADALTALGGEDWAAIAVQLRSDGSTDSIRLTLETAKDVGFDAFPDDLLTDLIVAQAREEDRVVGPLYRVAEAVPQDRLDSFLTELVARVPAVGSKDDGAGNNDLIDIGYKLIERRLDAGPVEPAKLWKWLKPFDAEAGYRRDGRSRLHEQLTRDDTLRRAVQKLVLFDEPGSKTVWERAWRLFSRSPGFSPTSEDLILLFNNLRPAGQDDDLRALLQLIRHSQTEGEAVRAAAKRLVTGRSDMIAWIDRLATPELQEWQIEQAERQRREDAERTTRWEEHRRKFSEELDAMRRGRFDLVVNPAKAYLNLFRDMGDAAEPRDRLVEWLGEDIAQAALLGIEAYLQSNEPPSARQMAESHAESKGWAATYIVVAALAERLRKNIGFADVSDDRLTVAFYELRLSRVHDHAGIPDLQSAVEGEMSARGLKGAAMRDWIEPQLEHRRTYVDQLSVLMNDDMAVSEATDLAEDWLIRFPDLPAEPEAELIDRLTESDRWTVLRDIASQRLSHTLNGERRRCWNAVALFTDFEAERDRLSEVAEDDPEWFWAIRQRLTGDRGRLVTGALDIDQLAWIVATFRTHFPNAPHPVSGWSGSNNPWDASDFIRAIASRLADLTIDEAVRAMVALRDAPPDSYTDDFRTLVVEQQRKQAETRYQPPSLAAVRAVIESWPPRTVADLQATLEELLAQVQKRVRNSPDDCWRGFYADDERTPRDEERCRDQLLTILGPRPQSIELIPEGHLADDNRADILAMFESLRLPIEIKGQWHRQLWHAADTQLDRLYASDYGAERRGIFLVLWFGPNVPNGKRLRLPGRSIEHPQAADALKHALISASPAARDGRIAVVVLDLERSSRV